MASLPAGAAAPAPPPAPALEARRLAKRLGGQLALAGVDLTIGQGEVMALLGENGSGKSTLVKILAGYHAPEPGGELAVAGRPVPLPVPRGRYRQIGLSFVFQDLGLALGMRVVENLFVGHRASGRGVGLRPIGWRSERRSARAIFDAYQVRLDPTAVTGDLRPTDRALLAIVRAAEDLRAFRLSGDRPDAARPDAATPAGGVLVLDEPTVFLPEDEKVFLFDLVRRVAADGTAVLFVSHDMTATRQIAHRAVVLRDGSVVGEVVVGEVSEADLVELISGQRALPSPGSGGAADAVPGPGQRGPIPATAAEPGAGNRTAAAASAPPASPGTGQDGAVPGPVLAVTALSGGRLRSASLAVGSGEIVGVAGLLGSGAEDIPYALFGGLPGASGHLRVGDWSGEVATLTPRRARRLGLALVPADRGQHGIAPTLSVAENMMSLVLGDYFRRGLLDHGRMRQSAAERCRRHGIRPPDPSAPLVSLSGGNQQRVVLAKWLERLPRVLVLHEPTQGVDVTTRYEIYDLLRGLAGGGVGILWVSTDYDELAAVSDRVLVCAKGSVVAEVPGPPFHRDQIASQVRTASAGPLAMGA